MLVYLVRHGESEGNKSQTYQFPETELSETGKRQAEILAERLAKIPIDFIYASSLKRAQQTAEIISKVKNLKIETWDDIREIRRPSILRGKHVRSVEAELFEKAYLKNYKNPSWKFSDEENFSDLKVRAEKVLNHLLKNHSDQNVLLVSHGTFIKTLTSLVLFRESLTAEIFWNFRHHTTIKNTSITICEHTEKFGWSLVSWNDMQHLG